MVCPLDSSINSSNLAKQKILNHFALSFHPQTSRDHSILAMHLIIPLQDILVRWKRMQGLANPLDPWNRSCWDRHTKCRGASAKRRRVVHAKTLGRKAFIDRVWKWRHQSGDTIIGQLKQLGARPVIGTACGSQWTTGLSLAVRKGIRSVISRKD